LDVCKREEKFCSAKGEKKLFKVRREQSSSSSSQNQDGALVQKGKIEKDVSSYLESEEPPLRKRQGYYF